MHKRSSATIEMYETHLGTRVLHSIERDGTEAITLYTITDSDNIPIGWADDDEFGIEHVYEWNTHGKGWE